MPALIKELIDKLDNFEIIRDQIAEILLVESVSQQALAVLATKDPTLWQLRVFLERDNPWEQFLDADMAFIPPIVSVGFETLTPDQSTSSIVDRQKVSGTFNIDCYGYGISKAVEGGGHIAADETASKEAQRAVRLVRNILMSADYAYLGFPRGPNQFVWKRWVQSITMFQPSFEGRALQNVVACRLELQVDFNEFSPQVKGEPMEVGLITVRRKETGEIYLKARYEGESDS